VDATIWFFLRAEDHSNVLDFSSARARAPAGPVTLEVVETDIMPHQLDRHPQRPRRRLFKQEVGFVF
jgi:hypothetical protein